MGLEQMRQVELEMRVWLAREMLAWIETQTEDPRQPAAKERVTQQLATLEAEMERRERLKEKPAPVVVGLKTLSLKARRL